MLYYNMYVIIVIELRKGMRDMIDVKFLKESNAHTLRYWEGVDATIKAGTNVGDGTIDFGCYVALVAKKIAIGKEVLDFLNTLDDGFVIYDKKGVSSEYRTYMKLVNS